MLRETGEMSIESVVRDWLDEYRECCVRWDTDDYMKWVYSDRVLREIGKMNMGSVA